MNRLKRTFLTSALALASVVFALAIAEVCLRLLDRPPPVRTGWLNTHLAVEQNEMGYRGQPIEFTDDDFVVLLVGDSQVEAKACSYHWMPERRLEHHLSLAIGRSVRVFSVGASGYGQDQEYLALRRYLRRFRADHVVAWLTLNNDVKDNTWPTFMPIDGRPKPTFWLDAGRLAGPNHTMREVVSPRLRLRALLELALGTSPDADWARRYLPAAYEPLSERDLEAGETVRNEWEELAAQGLLLPEGLAIEKNDRALRLAPASPRTLYGIDLTRELLLAMRSAAGEAGAGFTLMAVDKGDKTSEMDGVYRVGERLYQASSEQFWNNIDRLTESLDLELIPITEPLWQAGRYDHHLNEHATDGVMAELAQRMAPSLPISDAEADPTRSVGTEGTP